MMVRAARADKEMTKEKWGEVKAKIEIKRRLLVDFNFGKF